MGALHEFEKALLVDPENELAKRYSAIIKKKTVAYPLPKEKISSRQAAIEKSIRELEKRLAIREVAKKIAYVPPREMPPVAPPGVPEVAPMIEIVKERLVLGEKLRATQPQTKIELQKDMAFIIEGREISRWLITSTEIINVGRISIDQIKVVGKKRGTTYLHIWDQSGRWTLNIRIIPKRLPGLIAEEEYRRRLEEVESFKLRYGFSRTSFRRGKEFDSTHRVSLAFDHWLGLDGETPYGKLDARAQVSKLWETTDLTHFTLGLSDGRIGGFKDFDLRVFDYSASSSGLSFPGKSLRGVRLDASAFDNRLSYSALWGREGGGRFGGLSPGLVEAKDAFITGGLINYSPTEALNYKLSSFYGYGSDREEYLKDSVVDLEIDYRPRKNLSLGTEVAFDTDNVAWIIAGGLRLPKFNLTTQFRDIEKDFLTITGRPSGSGELGGLFNLSYFPVEWLKFSGRTDVYRDRLFPNPKEKNRLNFTLDTSLYSTINPTTSIGLDYHYVDERGKLSPRQSDNIGLGVSKRFPGLRNLATYLNYRHQKSENPESPTLNFTSNRLIGGLRLRLLGDLYYYLSKQIGWVTEEYTDEESRPEALETGLDYSTQIFKTPLYSTFRLAYRDEKEAQAVHGFLSGEDSLEVSEEVSYRPRPDFELYLSSRLRNIWAENPDIEERTELEIRAGGRVAWDTGLRWSPIGSIEGVVYKDLNDDGERGIREPGVRGVELFLGKKKVVTDAKGRYRFERVRGKRASVAIDVASVPSGFVLTTPAVQKVKIEQARVSKADFGIISRSEIYGIIFEDVDRNGKFGPRDIGIAGVVVLLEDGSKAITDEKGQYYFRRLTTGGHTITLDINSLPINYLPTVPLSKKITLFEGITYIHHIPLKKG